MRDFVRMIMLASSSVWACVRYVVVKKIVGAEHGIVVRGAVEGPLIWRGSTWGSDSRGGMKEGEIVP